MKKLILTALFAALTTAGSVQARQLVDRTNHFFVNLPDRYLLEANSSLDNKHVVINAYDPDDDSTFILKITPGQTSEIKGTALDMERTKFRESLMKKGFDPYVEGILRVAPGHEAIYSFNRLEDQGETLNYLIAKFWAHSKEYAFFCIQSTQTLRTQEFLDSVGSFICMQHNVSLPGAQIKDRPDYDKAKAIYEEQLNKANLLSKKFMAEGKQEEADKILAQLPKFTPKPTEYIPRVEINGPKPLPADITDKLAHDLLYTEHPEQVYARNKAKSQAEELRNKTTSQEEELPDKEQNREEIQPQAQDNPRQEKPERITPTPAKRQGGITVIRNGRATQDYDFQPEERKLSKKEIKELEKLRKEQEKFEKDQAKRQAKLEKIRQKELEKAKKRKLKEKD